MYAQLGSIKFQSLVGFDSLNDSRSTEYAEHKTIESKPKLQRLGSSLQEFAMSLSFHVAFCNPEEQYDELNTARENGEILTLVYGNGYVEGDFVITSISRKVNQTDNKGNYVHITCDVTLREYSNSNKLEVAIKRAKSLAFAVDVSRPLPVNISTAPRSIASATSSQIADAKKQETFFRQQVNRMKAAQNEFVAIIDQAQAFRDKCQVTQSKLSGYVDKINLRLSQIQNVINVYDIEALCPDLQSQVTACNAVTSQASSIISQYVSFPTVVSTSIEATAILTTATETYDITDSLKEALAKLQDTAQGLAAHISSRRALT